MEITYIEAIERLDEKYLDNIILIKHAYQLKDKAKYFLLHNSILIQFDPIKMHHDSQLYSDYSTINIISNNQDIDDVYRSLNIGKHIIKVTKQLDNTCTLLRSFKTLSTRKTIEIKNCLDITKVNQSELNNYEYLFGLIGYKIDDVIKMMRDNSAYVLSILKDNEPVCSCVVYNVYKNVWEISALATSEAHRREHYAEFLVSYGTNGIIGKNNIPRYHVNMDNISSYKLAIKCGYESLLDFYHYSYEK